MSPTNTITSSGISEGEEDIEDDIPLDKCVFCSTVEDLVVNNLEVDIISNCIDFPGNELGRQVYSPKPSYVIMNKIFSDLCSYPT